MSDDPFDPANFEMTEAPLPVSVRRALLPKMWYDAKHKGPTGDMYWPWIKFEVDGWFWTPSNGEKDQAGNMRSNWTSTKKVVTWVPGLLKWHWTIVESPHPHRPELGMGVLCTRTARGGRGKYKRNKLDHYGRKKMVRSWYDSNFQGPLTGEDYPWLGLKTGDFFSATLLPKKKRSTKVRVQANLAHFKKQNPTFKGWRFQFRYDDVDRVGLVLRVTRIK